MTNARRKVRRVKRDGVGLFGAVTAIAIAAIVAFGLCEVAIRVIYPAPPEAGREPALMYQVDADTGFIPVPSQMAWLDSGLATINPLGLRGEAPLPKVSGATRILIVGDSMTFGWGVADGETYSVELERRLKNKFPDRHPDVVNGGVAAYDLDRDARMVRRLAPTLRPDIVLVGLSWDDLFHEETFPDGTAHDVDTAPATSSASGARLLRLTDPASSADRIVQRSRVLYTARYAWRSMVVPWYAPTTHAQRKMDLLEGRHSPDSERGWADVKAQLRTLRELAEASAFQVGVVVLPIRDQVEGDYARASYQLRAREIAESVGLFVIDPLARLREHNDRESLFVPYDRAHLSRLGNSIVADVVFQAVGSRPEFAAAREPAAVVALDAPQ